MSLPRARDADVALLLEGTFPYVSGGVSSWVNQMIRAFPDVRFALAFIGSRPQDYGPMRYELPKNVVHLEVHYVHAAKAPPPVRQARLGATALKQVEELHDCLRAPGGCPSAATLTGLMDARRGVSEAQFLHSPAAWEFITQRYEAFCTDPSFVDYFWSVRAMHEPIWVLQRLADRFIPARAYHSISTGYAGFLGALLKHRSGRPLILSEHGIYTKERKIDLFQNPWIKEHRDVFRDDLGEVGYFRRLWVRFFEGVGKMCYDAADPIVSLYEANRARQIHDGAPAERTQVIANGIDVVRFGALRPTRPAAVPPVLILIGRVVPIKDVKTFVRALRGVVNRIPEAQGWIAGPEDEDPAYARECRDLVESLGLGAHVKFLGFRNIAEVLPQSGLLVLSSISEALPLVILEAYAAGLPVVVTDVGACRELVEGGVPADRALGAAGRVVGIADPEALAGAAVELLTDSTAWHRAQAAAVARVERYYTQDDMFARYRAIYDRALA